MMCFSFTLHSYNVLGILSCTKSDMLALLVEDIAESSLLLEILILCCVRYLLKEMTATWRLNARNTY